jgi:hypothetical protein
MDSRSEASRASRAALTCLISGKGIPSCRALFCTASFGRLSTTEARAADAPFVRSARSSSICSGVQLRLVVRGIRERLYSASAHIPQLTKPYLNSIFSVCSISDIIWLSVVRDFGRPHSVRSVPSGKRSWRSSFATSLMTSLQSPGLL